MNCPASDSESMWWRIKKIQYFGDWYLKCKMKLYVSWVNILACCLIAITDEKLQQCVELVLWWILNKSTCLIWDVAGIPTITNMATMRTFVILFYKYNEGRSQWSRGLRRTAARLLRSWVRIPPGAWMFVCYECCVLSGRGLCDELITRPEESYRLWCVVVCDLETTKIFVNEEEAKAH